MADWLKRVKLGAAFARTKFSRSGFPLSVQISVTKGCNFNCSYCDQDRDTSRDMSEEQLGNLIDDLAANGTRRISLSGGEPLLRKDLDRIIARIKGHGIQSSVVSNGYLLADRIGLVERVDNLSVSLDGPPAAQDFNRRQDSFQRVLKGIQIAKDKGIAVQIATVLTKSNANADTVRYILQLCQELGMGCSFLLVVRSGYFADGQQKKDVWELLPPSEVYRQVIQLIINEARRGAPLIHSAAAYEHCLAWPDYSITMMNRDAARQARIPTPKSCVAGRHYGFINNNGDVHPCCLTVGSIGGKNALSVGVKAAWEHIASHDCVSCVCPYHTDLNYLFSLKASTIWHHLRRGTI